MFIAELFTNAPIHRTVTSEKNYLEEAKPQLVVFYPGRFQPFHLGHRDVFQSLQNKFGRDHVYIATSNKVDLPKSPFNFTEKVAFMNAAGVPADRIVEVASPYKLPAQYDPANTIFVVVVGAPDADRLNPGSYKKDGQPGYYQNFEGLDKCQTADKHGYVVIANERKKVITLGGKEYDASHGTESRKLWNMVRKKPKLRSEYLLQMFGRDDPELERILNKIPLGEDSNLPVAVDSISPIHGKIEEHIVKVGSKYRLVSKHGNKNLGTYDTRAGAEKRERQVQYFKHANENLNEFAPGGGDDDDYNSEDVLFRLAQMWYTAADEATEQRAEQALAKMGWEIGGLESEEGGAFVMEIGDDEGHSYIAWSAEDLEQGLAEMDKSQPSHGRDGKISHSTYGSRDKGGSTGPERTAKATTADRMMKHAHDVMMKSMSDADKVKKGWRNPNIEEQGVAEAKGELWRVLEPRNIGGHAARYYVVKGQGKDLKIWRSKSGAGDFIKQADAEAKANDLNQTVSEAVGGNYLYHATDANGLAGILQSGAIRSAISPQKATLAQTQMPTVSVTRDWGYASGSNAANQMGGVGRDAVLVLDREGIESNFKTLGTSQSEIIQGQTFNPFLTKGGQGRPQATDAFARDMAKKRTMGADKGSKLGGEFEEVVVVPKGSLPIKNALVGFWINPKSKLANDPSIMNDPRRLDMIRPNQFVKAKQAVAEDAAGVGVVKNSKDPRYVMATMGDQNDVTGDTLEKEMRAYGLVGRKISKEKIKEAADILARLYYLKESLK